jgi:hypothetical protein
MPVRLALLPLLAAPLASAADPCLGAWRLDPTRTVYDPGPPPRAITTAYEDAGSGATRVTINVVPGTGERYTMTWTARYDGNPYTVFGSPNWDTVEYQLIDARTVQFTFRKAGRIMSTGRRVLAPDGASYTNFAEGFTPGGRPFRNTAVYVRIRTPAPPPARR